MWVLYIFTYQLHFYFSKISPCLFPCFSSSDYRYLEDVGRMTDRAARDTISHKPKSNRFVNILNKLNVLYFFQLEKKIGNVNNEKISMEDHIIFKVTLKWIR